MRVGCRLQALTSWIACFALLLGVLGPTLSHALRSDAPAGWAEICSTTGAKPVKIDASAAVDAGKSTDEGAALHALKHCPCCSTHPPVLGLPPAAPAGLTLDSLAFHVSALFLAAPRPLLAWASAQPRAPPLNA